MEENLRQGGFGRTLKAAREAAGIDLHDLSDTTKVQTRYIEALETENWSRVPGGVIGRGFVRLIAREIGADPERLVELYAGARGEEPPASRTVPPDTHWKSGQVVPTVNPRFLVALVVALAVCAAAFFGWKFYAKNREEKKAAQPVVHRLDIKALQNTWVKIKAKGVPEEKSPLGANEALSLDLEEAVVEVPDVAAVQITWDGQTLKDAAKPGESAMVRLPRDLESLKP